LGDTELLTDIEHLGSPRISGIRIAQSLFFCVVFCRSLFVLIHLAIVLFIFDLRLLITPLPTSNFSYPCCFGWYLCCSLYQLYVLSICQLCCRCVFLTFTLECRILLIHGLWLPLGIFWPYLNVSYCFQTIPRLYAIR